MFTLSVVFIGSKDEVVGGIALLVLFAVLSHHLSFVRLRAFLVAVRASLTLRVDQLLQRRLFGIAVHQGMPLLDSLRVILSLF